MLYIFGILLFLPPLVAGQGVDPYTPFSQLDLPAGVFGPDSVALDPLGQGPYVSEGDGRILKYNGVDFEDFAYTSPTRTKELCDGERDVIDLGPRCGRPLGFTFDPLTGDLYIVDAYGGLYRVGTQGGEATLLANSANGVSFNFLNGIDFDQIRRVVYFTDSSQDYSFTDVLQGKPTPPGDSSGRLLEYDTITGEVRVLLERLPRPVGPAASILGTYVVFSSFATQQTFKYWLIGPEANTPPEVLLNLPGIPIKTKRASLIFETFWVAVDYVVQEQPRIVDPFGYKFNSNGDILVEKNFTDQYNHFQVDVVQEYDNLLTGVGELYVGSRVAPYVGVFTT